MKEETLNIDQSEKREEIKAAESEIESVRATILAGRKKKEISPE